MKKIILLLLVMMTCFSFTACAEVVSEEIVEVDAIITEVDYDPPIITQYVKRVSDRDIYFEYDGIKGGWDVDKKTYDFYKDKVGESIKCYLITRTYDDGSVRVTLKAVEDK
jgi:hypothetical protein